MSILFEIKWYFKHKYRWWRILPKLLLEFKYLVCKIRGHCYESTEFHPTCQRCNYNGIGWGFAGDKNWLTGFQVSDDRWIR